MYIIWMSNCFFDDYEVPFEIALILIVFTSYASQHIWSLSEARTNWEDCARKGIQCKNSEAGGWVGL